MGGGIISSSLSNGSGRVLVDAICDAERQRMCVVCWVRLSVKMVGKLAEHLGDTTPHAVQRLLDRASWNADTVRDELVCYANDHLLTERDPGC